MSGEKGERRGRVTGIGGVFFKTHNRKATREWYAEHLDFGTPNDDPVLVWWRHDDDPNRRGLTVWGPFDNDTDYFGPGDESFMLNYRVDDLEAILTRLRAEGVEVLEKREDTDYGKFGWIVDVDGRRVELWQPPEGS